MQCKDSCCVHVSSKYLFIYFYFCLKFLHHVCMSLVIALEVVTVPVLPWQCSPEMPGGAEAQEAEGHQEDQYIYRHICGLFHTLRHYKVS